MRKLLSIIIVIAIMISFVACSSSVTANGNEHTITEPYQHSTFSTPTNELLKDTGDKLPSVGASIYYKERIEIQGNSSFVYEAKWTGEKIFSYGVDTFGNAVFYTIDPADSSVQTLPIQLSDKLYIIGSSYEESYPIVCINENGDYVLSIFSSDQPTKQTILHLPAEYQNNIVADIAVVEDFILITLGDEVVAFSQDGTFEKSLGSYSKVCSCIPFSDGSIVLARAVTSNGLTQEISTRISVFDSHLSLLSAYESSEVFDSFSKGAEEGCLIALKNGILYQYEFIEDTVTPLADAISSGINSDSFFCLPNEGFITVERGVPVGWHIRHDTELTVLTLATYNLNYSLKLLINSFNETSSGCKIKVIDYSEYDQTEGDGIGINRLLADAVAGYSPDLYDLSNLQAQDFVRNGLLENLELHLSAGADIFAKLIPSAVDALRDDGKLYYVMPSFSLLSVVGNTEQLSYTSRLSSEEFFNLIDGMPVEAVFGPELTKSDFLIYLMLFNSQGYIDVNAGTCNFNNSDFEKFLEFAGNLPSEIDYSNVDSEDFSRVYAGKQKLILNNVYGNMISTFAYYDTAFDGNAGYVGFPSMSSSGIALVPTSLVGISSKCSKMDCAIEFVSFILSDFCQTGQSIQGLPISFNALESRMEYWASEYEKSPKTLHTFYDGAPVEIKGTIPSAVAKAKVYAAINAADTLAIYDDTLLQLIVNESQPYFDGLISAKQAADRIQSKVQLYVAEKN